MSVTPAPPSTLRLIDLPDGDKVALEVSTPCEWTPGAPTVVLVHGLCGCSRSFHMIRLARKVYRQGLRAVRMNFRGCGPGAGLARLAWHSGRSEDLLAVLRSLHKDAPESRISVVGFSLGGNLALKLAGEVREEARGLLERAIAISPPVDLAASSRKIERRENEIYARMFGRLLKKDVLARHARFPDLPSVTFPPRFTLWEFDEIYTAPVCGFEDASDYYARSSSLGLLPGITVPCKILAAEDDPIVDSTKLRDAALPPNLEVHWTDRGGHLGFFGAPGRPGGVRWMDSAILGWLSGTASG